MSTKSHPAGSSCGRVGDGAESPSEPEQKEERGGPEELAFV